MRSKSKNNKIVKIDSLLLINTEKKNLKKENHFWNFFALIVALNLKVENVNCFAQNVDFTIRAVSRNNKSFN